MVKKRVYRGKSNATLAQEAAREVVKKREILKKLKEREALSPSQAEEAAGLVRQIEELKARIEALGFDPKLATSAAAALMIKEALKVKGKGGKTKVRRRRGGVGMYGLGSTIKIWR